MVLHRPDLLLIDAVAVADSESEGMSTRPGSASASPEFSPWNDDRRFSAAVPLLSINTVMCYGTINDPE
jgi:hypothetical protein